MAKATDLRERSFLGRGWDFPPTFSRSNLEVRMTADEDDIQKSLEILLSTTIGERFLQPNYGCNLENFVFEPMNATIQTLIKLTVKDPAHPIFAGISLTNGAVMRHQLGRVQKVVASV